MIVVLDWVSAKQKDSLAIQLPTEKIVYMAFIHTRRILDVVSPARQCGRWRENLKYVSTLCPNRVLNRLNPFEAAGTDRYLEIVLTGKRFHVVAGGL